MTKKYLFEHKGLCVLSLNLLETATKFHSVLTLLLQAVYGWNTFGHMSAQLGLTWG